MMKLIQKIITAFSLNLMLVIPAMAEEAAHHGGGLPQFNTATWPGQIFWGSIFFIVLYVVFSKSVIPALGKTVESRADYIAENIRKAESLSTDAEALRAEIEQAMKAAGQKANEFVAGATNTAKADMDKALSGFRARQEQEISATEGRIQQATQQAMNDMEKIAASLATQAAEKIAGISADTAQAETVVKSINQKGKLAA